ncbi:MAG: hypothetical protein HQL21_07625 [Candidatus Omnitrophica bacterium]|nr:hypothetical protein [Candidatus Omnitrophota bacterium]
MKVLKAGYLIGVAKGSYVWHQEHASFKDGSKKYEMMIAQNRKRFSQEWGRILRIFWVVDSEDELRGVLDKTFSLARQGNYISLALRFPVPSLSQILKDRGTYEHSGIRMMSLGSSFEIIWKVLIKKKKYHIIVNKSGLGNVLLRFLGIRSMAGWDDHSYKQVKFSEC